MSYPVNSSQEIASTPPVRQRTSQSRVSQDFLDSLNARLADSASPQGSPATLRPRRVSVIEDSKPKSKPSKGKLVQNVRAARTRARARTISSDPEARQAALEAFKAQYEEYSGTGTLRGTGTAWRGGASAERATLKFAKAERCLPQDLLKITKQPEIKQIDPVEVQEAKLKLTRVVDEWKDQEQIALEKLRAVMDLVNDRRSFALLVFHVCKTDTQSSESVDELLCYIDMIEGVLNSAKTTPWIQYLEALAENNDEHPTLADTGEKLKQYVTNLVQLLSAFYPLEARLLNIKQSDINISNADFQNLIAPSYQWIGRAKDLLSSFIKSLSKVHDNEHPSVCALKKLFEFTEHKMSEVAKGNRDSLTKKRDEARAAIERVGKMFVERDVQINEPYVSNPEHRTENYGYDQELESMKAYYLQFQNCSLKTIGELQELLGKAGFKNYSGTWKYPRLPKICAKLPEKPRQELERVSIDPHLVDVLTAIADVYQAWEGCLPH